MSERLGRVRMSQSKFTAGRSVPVGELSRDLIEVELGLMEAATWPARHRIHKYWGRKPSNIVQAYIELFTEAGDTVFDPFCGSGVVPVEATILGRMGIGMDNNPIAVELGRAPVSYTHLTLPTKA